MRLRRPARTALIRSALTHTIAARPILCRIRFSRLNKNMSRKSNDHPVCSEMTFVGNRLATAVDLLGPDKKSLRDKYLIGDPRDCPYGNAEEMKRRGFVGIYEKTLRHKMSPQKVAVLMKKAVAEW